MTPVSEYDKTVFNPNKKYHLHIDADTLLFSCAVVVDKDPCLVTHKSSGRKKEFESFTHFMQFLKEDEKGKKFTVKDFDVPAIGFAFSNFNNKLNDLLQRTWIGDYTLYLGGKTNFRKDIYPEYKANRKSSPAMRSVLFDYVCWKYKGKVVVSVNKEAEDDCLAYAVADEKGVIGYCDKDLTGQSGLFFNYQKPEDGVYFINKEQAFYNLCCQLLHGDRTTDNIKGIDFVSKSLKEAYSIKTKSVGEGTARKLLEDCVGNINLLRERVIDIYKHSYEDNWKEALQFTGSLVYISPRHNEFFDVNRFIAGEKDEKQP